MMDNLELYHYLKTKIGEDLLDSDGLPKLLPVTDLKPATQAIIFNIAHPERYHQNIGHFFADDKVFSSVWVSPQRYLQKLANFAWISAPDFSVYSDLPSYLQYMAVYRSRLLTRYFQEMGIAIVPVLQYSANCFFTTGLGPTFCVRLPGVRHSRFEHDLLIQVLEKFEEINIQIFVPSGYYPEHHVFLDLQALSEERSLEINYVEIIDRKIRSREI